MAGCNKIRFEKNGLVIATREKQKAANKERESFFDKQNRCSSYSRKSGNLCTMSRKNQTRFFRDKDIYSKTVTKGGSCRLL